MNEKQNIGRKGEEYATKYLINIGYTIIKRNFQCREGEIDIIAYDNEKEELVFVEVKTRTNTQYGNPADAVNETKKKHIYRVANYFLYTRNLINKINVRIDVIEIFIIDSNYVINHIKQIDL